jgi:predicted RecB family nuclease
MAVKKGNLRVCSKGHEYYKSSSCPVCPVCENEKRPVSDFLALIAAPARRALENAGITDLEQLAEYSETEILKLHGMGPGSIPKLQKALSEHGLKFRKI